MPGDCTMACGNLEHIERTPYDDEDQVSISVSQGIPVLANEPPEARREAPNRLSTVFRRNPPSNTLISDSLPGELEDKKFPFLSLSVYGIILPIPSKIVQALRINM